MTDQLPDQATIINQLQEKRDQALADYFSIARERLRKIIKFRLDYRLNGRVDESDILQDAFVRASKRIDHYLSHPEMPFFVWLRLELQQHLVDVHRRHLVAGKRDARRERSIQHAAGTGQTSMALAAHLVAQMTSVSKIVERAEQISALETSLESMNEMDREVIALRHFEELSNAETAEVLGIESSAASKRYLRSLKRLKEIMEQHQARS